MSPPTATPRTLEAAGTPSHDWEATADRLFIESQKLETELAAAKAECERLSKRVSCNALDRAEQHTALQKACRAAGIAPDKVNGDSFEVPGIEELTEMLSAKLARVRTELAARDAEYLRGGKMLADCATEWKARAERAEEQLALKNSQCERAERAAACAAKDKARLDWLADPKNETAQVLLPSECVKNNLLSMRDAIDAAMKG